MVLQLQAQAREKRGKNEKLRDLGRIPAVLYGEGVKNILLSVDEKEFFKALEEAGESSLIKLSVDGNENEVLIHQTVKHPISGNVLHIDFYKPSTKKKIEAEVELVFIGESPAVKDKGGVLMKEMHSVTVKGLAKDLPREIEIQLDSLKEIGDKIIIKDIVLPAGISFEHNDKDFVAHIVEPRKEEKPEETEQPEEAEEGEEAKGDEKTGTQPEEKSMGKDERGKPSR